MTTALAQALHDKLVLERIDLDIFRAENEATLGPRLFGGQVLAQALSAAQETIERKTLPLVTRLFLASGQSRYRPVVFQVERIRDGKSFSTRRIMGIQAGQAIFSMDASFQVKKQDCTHQMERRDGSRTRVA
jgi:acyl-CoA thioesterase-2